MSGGIDLRDPTWRGAGPVHFLNANDILDSAVITSSHPAAIKMLVAVDRGRTAVVQVARNQRAEASLLYDRDAQSEPGGFMLADGAAAVRFSACKQGATTEFNGGPIIARRGCYTFTVESRGKTESVALPFGVPSCEKTA